jgi:DNA-binding SARP family transcriptional activator
MRFQVLGPLEVTTSAGPLVISAKRPRALLAILLLHANEVVSIDRIIDGLWPGEPPRSALENVRTYVSQLRWLLGRADNVSTDNGGAASERAGSKARLESHPAGYRLLTAPEELDLLRFGTLAASGSRALQFTDYSSAAFLLGEAIELWRGAPLPELELGPAVRAKTVALEEWRWRIQTDWIRARFAMGQHAELVAVLRELIGERPFDESLRCLLMTALCAIGRTSDALSAFAEARHPLVHELGIDPGPEMRRVQAAILNGDVITDAHQPPTIVIPPYAQIPHLLPTTGPDFVGREAELRKIRGLVYGAPPDPTRYATVVVIAGPPGVGKTATGVAAAARMAAEYPHGQLYVDLAASTGLPLSVGDAVARLLTGFGISPETTSVSTDRCQSLYRSLLTERRMLVLLDDAVDSEQVLPLIPCSGQSLVIVTSRRFLIGMGCHARLNLEPLSDEDALGMLRRIVGAQRIGDEPAAALAIIRACGGLPSAIQIAGARLAALAGHPLQFLADRLADTDRVLDELSLDGVSLTESFAASYRSLNPAAQRCFRMLGVLDPDHITATDVGKLLELSAALADRQLEYLVHEGLLQPAHNDHAVPTYSMPTVLHTYARTCLSVDWAGARLAQSFRSRRKVRHRSAKESA